MDYIIISHKKNTCIRINENGQPETCTRREAQLFNEKKAKHIKSNLPKTLQRFVFKVEPVDNPTEDNVEEIKYVETEEINDTEEQLDESFLTNEDYSIPKNVIYWIDRVTDYNDLISDADERKKELWSDLSNLDKRLSNLLHDIELSPNKNVCQGYYVYKGQKEILHKRRKVKDEMKVIDVILQTHNSGHGIPSNNKMNSVVRKLKNRKFQIRDTEEIEWLKEEGE